MHKDRKHMSRKAASLLAAVVAMTGGTLAVAGDDNPSQRPGAGAKLPPGAEDSLRWGKPENGLRAALVILKSPGAVKGGDARELYLAVQNVSTAPIHLQDIRPAPELRELFIKIDGKTQVAIVDREPTHTDAVLKPRDVVLILVFPTAAKDASGRTTGSLIAEDTLKDPHQTMFAELRIEPKDAPAGIWTGRLRTGDTTGTAAAPRSPSS